MPDASTALLKKTKCSMLKQSSGPIRWWSLWLLWRHHLSSVAWVKVIWGFWAHQVGVKAVPAGWSSLLAVAVEHRWIRHCLDGRHPHTGSYWWYSGRSSANSRRLQRRSQCFKGFGWCTRTIITVHQRGKKSKNIGLLDFPDFIK